MLRPPLLLCLSRSKLSRKIDLRTVAVHPDQDTHHVFATTKRNTPPPNSNCSLFGHYTKHKITQRHSSQDTPVQIKSRNIKNDDPRKTAQCLQIHMKLCLSCNLTGSLSSSAFRVDFSTPRSGPGLQINVRLAEGRHGPPIRNCAVS